MENKTENCLESLTSPPAANQIVLKVSHDQQKPKSGKIEPTSVIWYVVLGGTTATSTKLSVFA